MTEEALYLVTTLEGKDVVFPDAPTALSLVLDKGKGGACGDADCDVRMELEIYVRLGGLPKPLKEQVLKHLAKQK